MTPPRLVRPLVAGLLVVLCAGCAEGPVGREATPDRFESDNGDRRAASASPSPSPSPLDAQQAAEVASRVRLTPEDLPGSTASTVDAQARTALAAAWQDYRSCAGAGSERLVDVPSDTLRRTADADGQLAIATTAVVADAAALETEARAYGGTGAAECARALAVETVKSLAGDTARLDEPEVSPVRPDVPGDATSAGHRVTTAIESGGRTSPVTVDVVGVAAGQIEVLVLLVSSGPWMDVAERDALLVRLAERAADAA